jgi:hypothetical protein
MTSPASTEAPAAVDASPSDDNEALYAALTSEVDRGVEDFGAVLAADAPENQPPPAEADKPAGDEPDAPVGDVPDNGEGAEAATAPAADPFAEMMKDGKPLTYTVDRQAKTFDGILEIPGKGALIPADKLDDVRNRLAREESNAAFTKELYTERQRYEQLGGYDGILKKLELAEQTNAAALAIMDVATKNPGLLTDPATMQSVIREATLAAREAVWQFRTEHEKQQQAHVATQSDAQAREQGIPNAVRSFMDEPAYKGKLTDADLAAAERHFAKFPNDLYFTASPEQALVWGVRPGTLLVDRNKMVDWFDDRIAARTQTATADTARKDAEKFNATVTPPKPAALPPRRRDGTFKPAAAVKPSTQKMSIGQLKRRALAGLPIPGDDDYAE